MICADDEYHSYVSHMAKDGTWGEHPPSLECPLTFFKLQRGAELFLRLHNPIQIQFLLISYQRKGHSTGQMIINIAFASNA